MNDLKVISLGSDGLVKFKIPEYNDRVSGIDYLIQLVVINLLTTVGSDRLNPARGGNIPAHSRNKFDKDKVMADLLHGFRQVENQIISDQQYVDLSPSERLAKLSLTNITYNPSKGTLNLTALIANESNESEEITL